MKTTNRYLSMIKYSLSNQPYLVPIILIFRSLLIQGKTKTVSINDLQHFHAIDGTASNQRLWLKMGKFKKSKKMNPLFVYKMIWAPRYIVFDGNGRLFIAKELGIKNLSCTIHKSRCKIITDILCYLLIKSRYKILDKKYSNIGLMNNKAS